MHIPFCHKLCYFCGCNKIVTRQQHKADQYLDVLEQEIIHRAPLFAGRKVNQLHWGGGTPTYLNKAQISRLMGLLCTHFNFNADAEISIEVDPREIELDVLDHLRLEGFNRLSMGVQDFNKEVQRLVNREQDEAFIFALLNHARDIGFTSTNIDLIYGLPKQTPQSFAYTLQKVGGAQPRSSERIQLCASANALCCAAQNQRRRSAFCRTEAGHSSGDDCFADGRGISVYRHGPLCPSG
ncbi:coproporphyrinogen III oxidase [Klebsiella michiganensis]|uniref:Oxygen-independent coproporphyrinogen III oxidase n=1 Tax=Klebsiella michiganensis TaxID=1134687 RepID=A0A7H4PEM6_9ENTR|nr:coproporphyrinogen III oxidase [Klebsiella michiganensis]